MRLRGSLTEDQINWIEINHPEINLTKLDKRMVNVEIDTQVQAIIDRLKSMEFQEHLE